MNTLEKLIVTYVQIEAIENLPLTVTNRKRMEALVRQRLVLRKKRMLELAGKNRILIDFIENIFNRTPQPSPAVSRVAYVKEATDLTPEDAQSWLKDFCLKHKLRTQEELEQLRIQQMRCFLTAYIEIFEHPEISEKTKLQEGNTILAVFRNAVDIGPARFTTEMERMVAVIENKMGQLQNKGDKPELYYWPLKNLSFAKVMSQLKEAALLPDISLATTVFENFDNQGLTLRWDGKRRELMYFLLLLFDGRIHYSETITEIAFKLFEFDRKGVPNARKNFVTDLASLERDLNSLHENRTSYKVIYDIVNSKT